MDTNIADNNYYFLVCDTPVMDARHRIDQLNHMGFIADSNKEIMANYFHRFSKSKEPVIFIYQNKIRNLGVFMDQKEFDKLGIEQSYEAIPRLKLSDLMKQQFDDLEFVSYNSLEKLPGYRRTTGVCAEAIRNDPYNIRYVPDYLLSRELIESVISREGNTLQYIPRERLNAGICRMAVENGYMSLQHVPFEFKNEDICRRAVKGALSDLENDSYRVLAYIPYTFICNEAIRQFHKAGVSGEGMAKVMINKEAMSESMCKQLFARDYKAYKHLPHLYRTKEMTEKAISLDGSLLAYVPPKQLNEDLCLSAIKNLYRAMEFVPPVIKTSDFCLKAVGVNGNCIEFIPPAYRSRQICETAIANSNSYDIVRNLPYPDLCLQVMERSISLKQFADCVQLLPPGVINKDIAYKIAEHAPDCLSMVPEKYMTKELCNHSLKNNPLALEYIPDQFKPKAVCMEAVKNNPDCFKYVPQIRITPEICLIAAKGNPALIDTIPDHIKNSRNIYTFNIRLETILMDKGKLTFDQIESMYQGSPIKVDCLKSGDKIIENQLLSYNRKTDRFSFTPDLKVDNKQFNLLAHKRNMNKGVKM
ncbi:MAG TPA: DUF4116 domain-containing protein [Dysgonomonas sp.]|uniref:DUF4116 domain-containing protein n=1 Tax=unclassified Dysgonomonas TaxID=2630389 RepID=UPI0025C5C140|nr:MULTISPECIES: DUF4116 domain-containing protein [unclassified Dysgonomonas]HML65206.1 DUF4116 domain-containing protein [Dysgonomonas sp.]